MPLPSGESDDTIVALSTPPGRSALAVVRLSGSQAFALAGTIVSPWPLPYRYAVLCRVSDPDDGSLIDECIVSAFPSPRSYSGENTVEFSTHGGHAVPLALVNLLLRLGAREAVSGEFTRRALLNGKLDLVQVEAIGDLIDAASDSMRRVALHQLDGGLSRRIDSLRDELLGLEALIAYDIDFPEEDFGPVTRARVALASARIQQLLQDLLETAPAVELTRIGAIVVIAGLPNVGKSSLFNAIIGEHRAIVTEIPGTTRDAIEAQVEIGKWPVRLVDTAGLHLTDEPVERLGIEVSQRYLQGAHAVIGCDDAVTRLATTIETIRATGSAPIIPVLTKADQVRPVDFSLLVKSSPGAVPVSAHSRTGLGDLYSRLQELLESQYGTIPVARAAITRARQRVAIEKAVSELAAFQKQWDEAGLPAPVAAVHIRAAVGALDELIGAVDTEDILGRLFATFCIGK